MDEHDVDRLVQLAAEYFAKDITPAIKSRFRTRFLAFPASIVEQELAREVESYPRLDVSRVLTRIQERAAPSSKLFNESKQQRRAKELEDRQINASLDAMKDFDLEEAKARVLRKVPEFSRRILIKQDPKTSHVLRSLIFQDTLGAAS